MSDLQRSPSEEIEIFEEAAGTEFEESMLITTDSLEEFSHELSTSLEIENSPNATNKSKSNINEIQGNESTSKSMDVDPKASTSNISALSEFGSQDLLDKEDTISLSDYLNQPDWLNQREQVFVLSSAGKPIYSLHGNEDKLATLFGVMQALVSVVVANQDMIMSIHAIGMKFVFLVKGPLILVAASRRDISVQQIQMQLT